MDLLPCYSVFSSLKMRSYPWLICAVLLLNSSCQSKKALSSSIDLAQLSEVRLDSSEIDQEAEALIQAYRSQLQGALNDTLLWLEEDRLRRAGTDSLYQNKLWNWVTDAVLTYAREELKVETSACLLNSGGLRKDLAAGPLLVRDVFELLPFDNHLVLIRMEKDGFDKMEAYLKLKNQPQSGFLMKYNEEGIISVNFLDPPSDSTVVTINYLADGGDNMNFWKLGSRTDTDVLLRDAFIWYCRNYPEKMGAFDQRTKID